MNSMRITLLSVLILAFPQGGFCADPGANPPGTMVTAGAQAAKKQGLFFCTRRPPEGPILGFFNYRKLQQHIEVQMTHEKL